MQQSERELVMDISRPDAAVTEAMGRLQGDLLLLGAGGKIGHGLALMAKRAMQEAGSKAKVICVSRFGSLGSRDVFEADDIDTIACDLTDADAVRNLPDAGDVIYLVGQKFGTAAGNESTTWLMNTFVPGVVARRWYDSRIGVYSSGNVYAYVKADSDGPKEDGKLGPIGEYAQSVIGRERVFEYFSRQHGTKVTHIRLNYANEPRYGVLVDIATQVAIDQPINLTQGYANVVWATDCNRVTLRCLDIADSPPTILNLSGPKISVREAAEKFGKLLGKDVKFAGEESDMAMLNNGENCWKQFGPMTVDVDQMIERIAAWLQAGHATWGKPTHFEVRDGKF
jgi:nucleoside-diphosphate-sugar epimerase